MDTHSIKNDVQNDQNAMEIENATLSWEESDRPILTNLDFCVKKGQLTAIVGSVGSGKSSILSAILGEIFCSYFIA